ncbi:MAG TPA: Lrp/AsnC ligand binding domain-containing protein [Chloroflexota bacterium]
MITAIVLINTERGQTEEAAEALLQIPGVYEVYSVTGEYDLVAILRVREYEEMAEIVPRRVSRAAGVQRTHTLMAFQRYSRHDLEAAWGLGMEQERPER